MQQGISKFRLLMGSGTIIGLSCLIMVFLLWTPYQGDIIIDNSNVKINIKSIVGMFLSLFVFFTGVFATIFFWIKNKKIASRDVYSSAVSSLRQGSLIGSLICILLFLQSCRILIWWDVLLVVGAVILIEMYSTVK